MTFCGVDPDPRIQGSWLWLMDPDSDPDPAIFVIDLQDVNKKLKNIIMLITFWRYIYIIFQRQNVQKKSYNIRNLGFFYYFCLMIEGWKIREAQIHVDPVDPDPDSDLDPAHCL